MENKTKDGLVQNFLTCQFFPTGTNGCKELFEKSAYLWDVLKNLSNYLSEQNLGNIEVNLSEKVFFKDLPLISIGKGTVVEEGAYIQGPAIIGEKNIVRSGAYIRGPVITGSSCMIGHGTEIKHSVLLNNVKMAHFNFVGNSVLGNNVNLGAGAKLANVRFDRREVSVFFNQKKIMTGLFKLGAILGDGVQIGCNCVTNPGTIIFPYSVCLPCRHVGGVIGLKKERE